MSAVWEAIENAWNAILDLTAQLVTPDWGALIALIPVLVALGVTVFFAWIIIRFATAGPVRRGPTRVGPTPPAGVHMPGPSLAPFLAAVGAFLTFFGLIVGGPALLLGLGALVLTLLYWGREAMRDYDHIEHPETLPAVVVGGPPPGVHMPGPSFRPLLVAIAAAVLFLGLVFGLALLIAGALMLFVALVGWLLDAGREYRAVAEADETGHLASQPAPGYPVGTLVTFAVLLVVGVSLTIGIIPPTSGDGGTGAAPSGSPAPGGSAEPGGSAVPEATIPAADVTIIAQNIAFDVAEVTVPAGRPFTIAFVNNDVGVPHNVAIHGGSPAGPAVWVGEIFNGVETRVYQVPALEAGAYGFICTVHPNMTGTMTAE